MAIVERIPAAAPVKIAPTTIWTTGNLGLIAGIAALVVVLLLPTPEGLPVAGHRMLAILAFAVIVWMTEALDYAVSAVVIAALMAFLLGLAPNPANPKGPARHQRRRSALAFSGFANTALALVASALFLAAAMTATGLDKRIALDILSRVGTETRHVVIGTILVGFVIAFMVPSTTARVACLVPITLGIIAAFGVNKKRRLRRHADDHHRADRQHLERRHQDRGGAEHGRHRLHREGASTRPSPGSNG